MPNSKINRFGPKFWYNEKGELHREDGPAYDNGGHKSWWLNGKRHREDGPAIILPNGGCFWYLNDQYIYVFSQEEFEQYLRLKAFI